MLWWLHSSERLPGLPGLATPFSGEMKEMYF
jgi:hypothetical protein